MIIDSLQYNGLCSCGREHKMETEFSVISSGCLKDADKYLSRYGLTGYTVAVYDENTYWATHDRHPSADLEIVLNPENLHANEHGVALLEEKLPKNAEVLIAVGSGTVHDITRYCAYTIGADFVSCPTAASVDGFCSSVAAMTWNGCKKTLTAVAPKLVIADTEVFMNAPIRLTRSGFGDMIGKYVALTDWKISSILTGEFYCDRVASLTRKATEEVQNSIDGILAGDCEAYEKLMCGLLLSGLAMQMMGNSRPASGAEHHISHFIEMSPLRFAFDSDALHGEKVGVGTLLALREYKRLSLCENPAFIDYTAADEASIISVFGEHMATEILTENKKDAAADVSAAALFKCWEKLCAEISKLPDPSLLESTYKYFGVKSSLEEIDVSEGYLDDLLDCSYLVRNRLTLMRLRKCIK